jgi:riboflavin synthase
MAKSVVVIPSPRSDFVALGRTRQGTLFRKQILRVGEWVHPNDSASKFKVSDKDLDTIVRNFENGICDIVQVPKVNGNNEHTEDPDANIGETIGLEKQGTDLFALIDARDVGAAKKLGKTLLGASAMLHLNYEDKKTGNKVGPTLLHVAVTNRPYITDLKGYEEVVAASADLDRDEVLYLASPESDTEPVQEDKVPPTKEELLAQLKKDHGIDFEEMKEAAAKAPTLEEELAKVKKDLEDAKAAAEEDEDAPEIDAETLAPALSALAKAGVIKLTNTDDTEGGVDKVTAEEVGAAVVELANKNTQQATEITTLSATVKTLKDAAEAAAKREVEGEIDGLIKAGRVLPAQKDDLVQIALTNRDMFNRLVPETAIVSLSETGVTVHDDSGIDVDAEVARYADMAKKGK